VASLATRATSRPAASRLRAVQPASLLQAARDLVAVQARDLVAVQAASMPVEPAASMPVEPAERVVLVRAEALARNPGGG